MLVDQQDADRVHPRRWWATRSAKYWYVCTFDRLPGKVNRKVYLHRFIVGAGPATEVHHRNSDTFDNRRSNLVVVTRDLHRVVHNGQVIEPSEEDYELDQIREELA